MFISDPTAIDQDDTKKQVYTSKNIVGVAGQKPMNIQKAQIEFTNSSAKN